MAPPTVLVATVAMFMVMEYARPRTRWCARELFIGRDASLARNIRIGSTPRRDLSLDQRRTSVPQPLVVGRRWSKRSHQGPTGPPQPGTRAFKRARPALVSRTCRRPATVICLGIPNKELLGRPSARPLLDGRSADASFRSR
jgi:hypothetical protein